jgi:glycosyltransferase involved in cell wall biosynthesis
MSEVAEQLLLTTSRAGLRVAVLLPCYNEQEAIGKVVRDFRQALPEAIVYVYDNNSRDETRARAAAAGAVVRSETQQGKGFVVRRMFADVEADVYVLVDGDDTYHAPSAPLLVERLLAEQLDMVVGRRVTEIEQAYRPGHRLGNRLLTGVVARVFGDRFKDILSGYRVFSRRFVKSFPALTKEFEIETELTVHALELDMPIAEVDTPYKDRPAGSVSKLRTYRDGVRILTAILVLFKEERPLAFFGLAGLALAVLALGLGYPVLTEYLRTGLVPRFPTAILATGLMILAFLSFTSGLVLETVTRGRKELKRLAYLTIPGPR